MYHHYIILQMTTPLYEYYDRTASKARECKIALSAKQYPHSPAIHFNQVVVAN